MVATSTQHFGARAVERGHGRSLPVENKKHFKINPFAVAAGMVGLSALDMVTTQMFFNLAHTDSTFAEKSLIGQMAMGGGNSVFTPEAIAIKGFQTAYNVLPYLALKGISYAHRDKPDSWYNYGPNVIANMFAIGPLVSGSYVDITNSWNVLHAAGVLPTYAPWGDAVNSVLQYWVYDAHVLDAPLQGLMNYMDFADSTGLGFGNMTLLALGTMGVTAGGIAVGAKVAKSARNK